eukprot:scaffold52079_cov72-Phaeocystis_antarctica.AAC.1
MGTYGFDRVWNRPQKSDTRSALPPTERLAARGHPTQSSTRRPFTDDTRYMLLQNDIVVSTLYTRGLRWSGHRYVTSGSGAVSQEGMAALEVERSSASLTVAFDAALAGVPARSRFSSAGSAPLTSAETR